ncbi:hypothetical protein [Vulcanisaeta distributa]|uniref:hypothetical protein n=1 Tax=Vulcanisaeta distributa TaxID=164451 RepID=UPI0006D14F69|nr:hypothetical protein [Vulcanisaeta distributa]
MSGVEPILAGIIGALLLATLYPLIVHELSGLAIYEVNLLTIFIALMVNVIAVTAICVLLKARECLGGDSGSRPNHLHQRPNHRPPNRPTRLSDYHHSEGTIASDWNPKTNRRLSNRPNTAHANDSPPGTLHIPQPNHHPHSTLNLRFSKLKALMSY